MLKIEKGEKTSGIEAIAAALCQVKNRREMEQFLGEVLTPAERYDLALRWELMRRLNTGMPQRQIASDLKISLCKITRGAKVLKNSESISRKLLTEKKS
ncbi:MAG: transcriptional regulator [Planctomycetes bacterium]|nr:transcriptional regulator [Planctomycetota bacterium]